MIIKEAIVHRLEKIRQQPSVLHTRLACLPVDPLLTTSVERARKTYGTSSSKAFGVFEHDTLLYPLSDQLLKYVNGALSLIDFSVSAAKLLQKEIDKQPLATGAYILFVNYEEGGKTFVMIILLKLRGEVGIDDVKLELNSTLNLDVDNLHEAARINIDNWKENEGNYISFVKKIERLHWLFP